MFGGDDFHREPNLHEVLNRYKWPSIQLCYKYQLLVAYFWPITYVGHGKQIRANIRMKRNHEKLKKAMVQICSRELSNFNQFTRKHIFLSSIFMDSPILRRRPQEGTLCELRAWSLFCNGSAACSIMQELKACLVAKQFIVMNCFATRPAFNYLEQRKNFPKKFIFLRKRVYAESGYYFFNCHFQTHDTQVKFRTLFEPRKYIFIQEFCIRLTQT